MTVARRVRYTTLGRSVGKPEGPRRCTAVIGGGAGRILLRSGNMVLRDVNISETPARPSLAAASGDRTLPSVNTPDVLTFYSLTERDGWAPHSGVAVRQHPQTRANGGHPATARACGCKPLSAQA